MSERIKSLSAVMYHKANATLTHDPLSISIIFVINTEYQMYLDKKAHNLIKWHQIINIILYSFVERHWFSGMVIQSNCAISECAVNSSWIFLNSLHMPAFLGCIIFYLFFSFIQITYIDCRWNASNKITIVNKFAKFTVLINFHYHLYK